MSQETETAEAVEPLNPQQLAFARELGVALAAGGRDAEILKAYEAAGYKPNRGNARRLAADPRVRAIALEECREALQRAGLHIEYLQAKSLELLQASASAIHRRISKFMMCDIEMTEKGPIFHPRLRSDMTADEMAELDAATWPLSKFKITEKGVIEIDLPDKKALIEMLAKQIGAVKDSGERVADSLEALVLEAAQRRRDQGESEAA